MWSERIIGWDIGGAHLKVALVEDGVRVLKVLQLPCPLWRGVEQLHRALDEATARIGMDADFHAVTMTGELADNFSSRVEGVKTISGIMEKRFGRDRVKLYAGTEGFLDSGDTEQAVEKIASANWLASAAWLSRTLGGGLLIDIGSTTTDLVPFSDGRILARGSTDLERLRYEELVYTGVVRTPLMTLARRAPMRGEWINLMCEHFAASADIYRILDILPESADQHPAADDGAKTVAGSERRLARMLGMGAGDAGSQDWYELARYFEERQLRLIDDACTRLFSRNELEREVPLIGAGVGRFLVIKLAQRLDRRYVDFNSLFEVVSIDDEHVAADCVPAVAVALLGANAQ